MSYSTTSKSLLHPWYVTGLSDAESSFGVQVQKPPPIGGGVLAPGGEETR